MPGLADRCMLCRREFPFSLPRCNMCRKAVCSSCNFRIGGSLFCSKECGHAFFYGGQEDVEDGRGDPDADE
ncbi:MAG TPA: hypothetical protein VIA29_09990 [Thermoanaerobaculia bacterium]